MRLSNMSARLRISKPFKKTVIGIGVTLCVTPFFVSAQANDSSRMLLELQSMRQEIAELRDMVERQQYQLRKLQNPPRRSGPPALGNTQNTPGYAPNVSGEQTAQGTYSVDGANADSSSSAADGSYPAEGSPSGSASPVDGSSDGGWATNNGAAAPTQSTVVGDRDAYDRPFENAGNGAPVSESPINVPPVQSNNGYPPVVDRSIGSNTDADVTSGVDSGVQTPRPVENTTAAQDRYNDYQNNAPAGPDGGSPQVANTRPIDASKVPSNNGSGGVIAVPDPVASTGTGAALSEQDYYQQGFELLKKSDHEQAVSVFKQQIGAYPRGEYADDAYYWIAESMYVNRKLDESKDNFRAIIDEYKQSPRLPDALLKTAYIEQEQGNEIEARILLQEIMQFHPRSNAAISAKNRLAELK